MKNVVVYPNGVPLKKLSFSIYILGLHGGGISKV